MSSNKPAWSMACTSGLMAMTMTQPMATYTAVETFAKVPLPNHTLKSTPSAASVHTKPKSVHPHAPRRTPSVNGVYVPAMSR